MTDSSRDDFRIVGGHPALDLVNTVKVRIDGHRDARDFLRRPTDLLAWSERIELVSPVEASAVAAVWDSAPDLAEKALRGTYEIREAAYLLLSGRAVGVVPESPQESTYERLMLRWAAAAARSMLVAKDGGPGVADLRVGTAPALMIPDRLVFAAVELVRTVDLRQLRACPVDEGGCGWLFLDRSRNGSRRWCSMEDCGTRAKIRKLTERRRATTVKAV
jgi:predicted RNA-binding Zn ribbon-like protein